MDPHMFNGQNQTPVVPIAPDGEMEITQPQQPITQVTKKSHKKLFTSLAIVVTAFILTLAGYLAYQGYYKPSTKTADSQQVKAPAKIQAVNPTVDASASLLTGSALSESSLTSTDDSNTASDAGAAASNVGDGVDENNF